MSDLLNSIKADLLDRRLLPLVALVGVGLVAAIAYAVAGSGGSGSTPAVSPVPGTSAAVQSSGLQVSTAAIDKSVAETTDGAKQQRGGKARNPFTPFATTAAAGSTTSKSSGESSSSSTTSSGSGSETSSGSSGTSKSEEPAKSEPAKKPKPKPSYHVAVLFGVFPGGATAETVTLTPYENLKLQAPLPNAKQALIVFRGVTSGGKSATFTLLGEAILHGQGACLPNASQCQAIDLKPGETEQLEYVNSKEETTVYELRVVSIAPAKASTASKASAASVRGAWAESKLGRALLRQKGLLALPFLRYSSQPGVLVFAQHKAFGARAHRASEQHRHWR